MDFLEIRRKAKERAAREGAAAEPAGAPADASSSGPPTPSAAAPAAAEEPGVQASPDQRFTTWRPGSGERPFVPPPEAPPPPRPAPSDFAVFDPARAREVPDPAPASPGPLASAPVVYSPPAPPPPLPTVPPATGSHPRSAAAQAGPAFEEASPRSRRAHAEPGPSRGWQALPAPDDEAAKPGGEMEPPGPEADPLDDFFYRPDEEAPVLGGLTAGGGEPARAAAEDTGVEEYLTFRLGAEEYGVLIDQVHEVLKAPAITEVPRAPPGILGVVTVRGEVVAVFDPRRRLGLPGAPPGVGDGRIVIVDDGAGPCGLLVDAVASVVRLARRSIEPCPQGIGGAMADCLAGIGRERGRLFTVLDLPALLRRAPGSSRRAREGRAHDPA